MGCCCCIPASLPVLPWVDPLPAGIVQVTEDSPRELIEDFLEVMALSFCGTTTSAPEALLNWCLDPSASGKNPASPLLEPPSEERLEFYRWLMRFIFVLFARHGGCYALMDNDNGSGRVVACTVTIPPNDRNLKDIGICESLRAFRKMGFGSTPGIMKERDLSARFNKMQQINEVEHAKHAPGRQLFVVMFCTDATQQGKGYGRRLMEFLTLGADQAGVDCFLETGGMRNERFYAHHGYQLKGRAPLEHEGEKYEPDGLEGMSYMLRPAPNTF